MGIYEPYIKAESSKKKAKFSPRPEQSDAIDNAFKYFKKNDGKGAEFLWNAKMRFGKTVCALWLIERLNNELGKKKVLIVTHRPVVNASWYGDFKNLFKDSLDKYSYGTSKETDDESSLKDFYDIRIDANSGKCVLFFVSMQYLRLSKLVGGKDESQEKKDILNYNWDLVIIDEAHEGTQTDLGEGVINYLHKDSSSMLYLSGTPFNLLDKFKAEQIYNWDYIKEQQYKRQWDIDHKNKKSAESQSLFGAIAEDEEVNPYRELPRMEILTFRIGEMTDEQAIKDAATGEFSFAEFFRIKTGHDVPKEERGKFLHEEQVLAFIKKLCQTSTDSHYPFSNDEYRKCFRHTLWVVPGVKEAQALKKLLEQTPLCTKMGFKIINVAGNSEDDEQRGNALDKVLNAIGIDKETGVDDSDQTRTITLSCGRLTTGVTVRPWTAVLYLKGSDTTNASTYMQTIFRVQSPHTINGMMKNICYVFDFAPERALTMMAETAKYSRAFEDKKKGEKKQKSVIDQEDKEKMKELLAECPIYETTNGSPVIAQGRMKAIDCERLFSQLNSVYVDKVVRNGFDHPSLYNYEEFLKLDLEDEANLNYIDSMFGDETKDSNSNSGEKAVVNSQDEELTPEQKAALEQEKKEREEAAKKAREDAKKKYAEKLANMTPEEREAFLYKKEEDARKLKLIHQSKDKLAGLSKRIPLMMYGANVEDFKEVTIETFTHKRFIDDESWNEFMPKGVSRELFKKLSKFYNADVFRDAGVRIRQLALEADSMKVEERIARIAQIFKWFKNPDKETVLTPWEVVNRHMSTTLGGYTFFEEDFKTSCIKVDEKTGEITSTKEPRFVSQGNLTKQIFGDDTLGNIDKKSGFINTKILEINSKTGLYPLYIAYSLYRTLLPVYASEKGLMDNPDDYSAADEHAVWDEVIKDNLYVICNTKMAERITRRTLLGFRKSSDGSDIKLHVKQDKLITRVSEDRESLINDLLNEGYWTNNKMNKKTITFNAVVGNPPYQVNVAKKDTDNGQKRVKSIFHLFQQISENVGLYTSLIYPGGRWIHRSGKGMAEFGLSQINDPHLRKMYFFPDCNELFKDAGIDDGISIVFKDMNKKQGGFNYIYSQAGNEIEVIAKNPGEKLMNLNPANDIIINTVDKVVEAKEFRYLHDSVLSQKLFGIESTFVEQNPELVREYQEGDLFNAETEIKLFANDKGGSAGRARWYITSKKAIEQGKEYINLWKVVVSSAHPGGQQKRSNQIAVFDNNTAFGRSRVALKAFKTEEEAKNFYAYANSALIRFTFLLTDEALTSFAKKVPDILDYSSANKYIDFSHDIDSQIYKLFGIEKNQQEYIQDTLLKLWVEND